MYKPEPPNDVQSLIPPNTDYRYFEGWRENRFRTVVELAPVDAWWLADAALLAYADQAFVAKAFEEAGLTQNGYRTVALSQSSTHCLLAYGPELVFVAFRGTELRNLCASLNNWHTNLRFSLVPDGRGGRIHEGFQEALDQVWDPLCKEIGDVLAQGPARRVWLTGHSLGAALATLAADRALLQRAFPVGGLYTFGSPRVGNAAFARRVNRSLLGPCIFRFVNYDDIVPRVPPPLGYRHVGRLCYFNKSGRLQRKKPGPWWQLLHGARDQLRSPLPSARSLALPEWLVDHAPIKYAVRTWNHYEASSGKP
jgi:hypothetical protein